MKKLAMLIVAAVVGLVGYNYFTSGEIKLLPGRARTAEEREFEELAQLFEDAREQVGQAHRAAGATGVDMTADVEAARRSVNQVARSLDDLRKRLTSDAGRQKADELARAIEDYRREIQ